MVLRNHLCKVSTKGYTTVVTLPRRCPACSELIATVSATAVSATAADACFSACGHYRWWLWRQWQPLRPELVFIGLNPSRADGQRDDPTLRRLVGFAQAWGYGSVRVLNLFGRITPNPALLKRCNDPVGPDNDLWLRRGLAEACSAKNRSDSAAVWLGWGNQGRWLGRDQQLLALLQEAAMPPRLLALGLTALGQPRHPLYAPATTRPVQLLLPMAQTAGPGASCGQRADQPWPAPPAGMPFTCT